MDVQGFIRALGSDVAITVYLSVAIVAATVLLIILVRKKKARQAQIEKTIKEKKDQELERIVQNKRG